MKKIGFFTMLVLLLFINQSFGAIIYDLDFDNGTVVQSNFGQPTIEDGIMKLEASNMAPYVQPQFDVSAGYENYSVDFDMMTTNFIGSGQNMFRIFFDTPVITTLINVTDGSSTWSTHNPETLTQIDDLQDDVWMHYSFQMNFPNNTIEIIRDGQTLYNGLFGASGDDLVSIRLSLGDIMAYNMDTYSHDSVISIDNFIVDGFNGSGDNNGPGGPPPNPVPEPATMLLFGTGIVGLCSLRRKK